MATRMTPEQAIKLMEQGETSENKAEYKKAYQLALEAMRYWAKTSYAAELLRERAKGRIGNVSA